MVPTQLGTDDLAHGIEEVGATRWGEQANAHPPEEQVVEVRDALCPGCPPELGPGCGGVSDGRELVGSERIDQLDGLLAELERFGIESVAS